MASHSDSQPPEAAKELSLVGKVEMRIALADSDEKLQTTLKTYLAPLLLKLASPHIAVRNKVISICQHINTRIQPEVIKLPVQALIEQFRANLSVSLIRHFDLLYIQKGIPRLSVAEKAELFPTLLKGVAGNDDITPQHASLVMNQIVQVIEHFKIPGRGTEEDNRLKQKFGLFDQDSAYLASWFGKLILFTTSIKQAESSSRCPGLTRDEYSFLAVQDKVDTWNSNAVNGLNLSQTKARVARLLASGLFTDRERLFPALFASAEPAHAVSEAGEDMLKRVLPNTDLEDKIIVAELFEYLFGSEQDGRSRVRGPLRLKILNLLSKSVVSTSFVPEIKRIVEECFPKTETQTSAWDLAERLISNSEHSISSQPRSGGLEMSKLRSATFAYINFIARQGEQKSLYMLAPDVISSLQNFVMDQGWPTAASTSSQQDLHSRGLAYEVIGLLARAGPRDLIVTKSPDVLEWLFRALAEDHSSNTLPVSVEEALSSVLTAFSKQALGDEVAASLETLLLTQMTDSDKASKDPNSIRRSTRHVAIRFANRCLPFSSTKARAIDLLGLGAIAQDRSDVSEEGQRGLSPYWYRMLNGSLADSETIAFPKFAAMTDFVFRDFGKGADIDNDTTMLDGDQPGVLVENLRSINPSIFTHALLFNRLVLLNEVLAKAKKSMPGIDSEWERKLNTLVATDAETRTVLRSTLASSLDRSDTFTALDLELLTRGFISILIPAARGPPVMDAAKAIDYIVDLCAIMPDEILTVIAPDHVHLIPSVQSNDIARRRIAAHTWGILASHTASRNSVQVVVRGLVDQIGRWDSAIGSVANSVYGSMLALAYYYSRCAVRSGSRPSPTDKDFQQYIAATLRMVEVSTDSDLRSAAFTSLGELCQYQVVSPDAFGSAKRLQALLRKIYDVAKTGDEAAALSLGKIAMSLPEPDVVDESTISIDNDETSAEPTSMADIFIFIASRLHKLHEIRTAESHFAIGEALSNLCSGWSSTALATAIDIPSMSPPTSPARTKTLDVILSRTLRDCSTTKPSLRKASVIWLLCLVQFCGAMPAVQGRLAECQMAFKRCLIDRDDLVQETASRGLGLVYERGPPNLRADLVRDLMSSFSDRKEAGSGGLAGQVGSDTQLFEPGALPTGSGESVSTYRDIMNLASEVGDSSLVYRFMNLASSNAIWSSRAAFGRFGLSTMLSGSGIGGETSGDGVHSYLAQNPKIVISLYRYRFDPNEGVRRSMNEIWNSLVTDSTKTVDAQFAGIVEDLLAHILTREWRTRQACCAALADLVQGRQLDRYGAYLERIWTACFRVLDDIKESVRAAAASLARTLTGILTRTLEADSSNTTSSAAQTMLSHVLPFLLGPSGLDSSAREVSLFATKSLLDIVKKSSARALRGFIPDLVDRLLGLIGSLEHESVEYIRLNAAKYNITEQKIDDMRLSGIRGSPIMESIERCLDLMGDAATMAEVYLRIEAVTKSAIALPTKVACSRVLVGLATRHALLFRPHADAALKALERAVQDRNETVGSAYAVSAGYVARGASDAAILRLVSFTKKLYFDSEGDREGATPRKAITAGDIIRATGKHANDRFNALASEILPFVFVAKHDGHDAVRTVFGDAWNDNVGGSRAISLYLKEVAGLAAKYVDSPQWEVKHTVSKAVADATTAIGNMGTLDDAAGSLLWPVLERPLAAKTWAGKEVVSDALVKFVEKGERFWKPKQSVHAAFVKIAVREAKRQNPTYQVHSVANLGKIARATRDVFDMSSTAADTISSILTSILQKVEDNGDEMEVDEGQTKDEDQTNQALLAACLHGLGDCIRVSTKDEAIVSEHVRALLKSLESLAGLTRIKKTRLLGKAVVEALAGVAEIRAKEHEWIMWKSLDGELQETRTRAESWCV